MRPLSTILVADDDEAYFLLLSQAFQNSRQGCNIQRAHDGDEAIAYLAGENQFADREKHPVPNLLLLDVRMPRKNGFDVLRWVRREPGFRTLPVVVLSSSNEPADIKRAYELGANSYLSKPGAPDCYRLLIGALREYWLAWNEPPPGLGFSGTTSTVMGDTRLLQAALLTISDPRGNWQYGWELICGLARMHPLAFPAPFRHRTDEEMRRAGLPHVPEINPGQRGSDLDLCS
jgi:CheY-like chemotaxis protein